MPRRRTRAPPHGRCTSRCVAQPQGRSEDACEQLRRGSATRSSHTRSTPLEPPRLRPIPLSVVAHALLDQRLRKQRIDLVQHDSIQVSAQTSQQPRANLCIGFHSAEASTALHAAVLRAAATVATRATLRLQRLESTLGLCIRLEA